MADDAILNEDFIEIDAETDFYAQDKSNTEEFDCDRMMKQVFEKLRKTKRIIVKIFNWIMHTALDDSAYKIRISDQWNSF